MYGGGCEPVKKSFLSDSAFILRASFFSFPLLTLEATGSLKISSLVSCISLIIIHNTKGIIWLVVYLLTADITLLILLVNQTQVDIPAEIFSLSSYFWSVWKRNKCQFDKFLSLRWLHPYTKQKTMFPEELFR